MNIGIIGCGLIGEKRARAIRHFAKLSTCFDLDIDRAKSFSEKYNCTYALSLDQLLEDNELDAIIVSTRHDSLAKISEDFINKGVHVFIEKPGALNIQEFNKILQAKKKFQDIKVHIGYNHRFHQGIRKALEIYKSGDIGEIMFLRARYGHGGRLGYENEWRSNKELSGGGELIDQGSHLLDLSIAFLGEVFLDYAATATYFWNMAVEDNAFISIKNRKGNIAFLQASCTEWKNMFSLEVYGKTGKIEVSGLGGSYGLEKLAFHKMSPTMGIPNTQYWDFPSDDNSWELEILEFINDIKNNTSVSDNLDSSKIVLDIISEIYERQTP